MMPRYMDDELPTGEQVSRDPTQSTHTITVYPYYAEAPVKAGPSEMVGTSTLGLM